MQVNGPGEASQTEIGITGGGKNSNMLCLNGIQNKKSEMKKLYLK